MNYLPVSASTFRSALATARSTNAQIEAATSSPSELPTDARYFLHYDMRSGFGITHGGELIAVHSTVPKRGDDIISSAINHGASRLDCFDGYLPKFYSRHGFHETRRVANWTVGGPDVVFMAR